jgi:signal transduction histidine kinase/DNA-binding response OmpR family regulator
MTTTSGLSAGGATAQHDISEELEHRMRLFEQAPGFVCFFRGPEHVYELQNAAHARLAKHKEIIGKSVRAALPELEGQGFFELLDAVYRSGEPFVGRAWELNVAPQPGLPEQRRFIDFVYQPIVGPDGKVMGIFSQGNDVTEQVLAQELLEHKQHELEQLIEERTQALQQTTKALELVQLLQGDKAYLLRLFDQAPGFTAVLKGPQHVFEIANRAYLELTGHRFVLGKSIREAMPEVAGQGFFELLDNVYASGAPFVGRAVPISIQFGSAAPLQTRYLDFVCQPIIDEAGQSTGIFVQGNDVTPQKLAQDEVARYQNELEQLVTERSRVLAETQTALQHAQKLEAIGKLTGGVAHDFNNVLQVIGGNLQLLQSHVGNNEVAVQRLDSAIAAVERGARLSSQLLAFARRQPLQPMVTDLGRLIRGIDGLLRQALGEAIDIETVVAGGLWNTLVDPHLLENAILNLALNAADAMDAHGKLTLELGNAVLDDDYVVSLPDVPRGQYVMLAVSDTGSGMTPEVLERAVEPFFTTKPEGKGTGLGLSMVYGFVKQSGGHIRIYSEVGHGTTVRMYFPRSYEAAAELRASARGPAVGGSEVILVVEDDLAVQATAVEMLAALGYRVLKADNADNALGILKSGVHVDLLFTDIVMPGQLRSPELAKQAARLMPGIAVLFTSGYTQNAIVHGGRLDPGVHLLSKPYRREQLAHKIRQLLADREQAPAEPPVQADARAASPAQRRVLVVEDDPDAQEMACEVLRIIGCTADGCGSGEEALDLLRQHRYDVLFTDFGLPGIDGVELAKRARASQPHLKVIFASGYGDVMASTPDFRCTILPKPFNIERLQQALDEAGLP